MPTLFYTPHFKRHYKKLPTHIKDRAKEKECVFRSNPFDPSLSTHKLGGKLEGFWSFSVTNKYRIVFTADGNNEYTFHMIGDHDIYC